MARGRRRGPKDPYEGLSGDWRAAVEGAKDDEFQKKLSEVALEQQQILDDIAKDTDYQEAKARLKVAGESYRDRRKTVKLKLKFAKRVLESRGKA